MATLWGGTAADATHHRPASGLLSHGKDKPVARQNGWIFYSPAGG